ncbi:MAG: nicotinamide riboside transporter PnuC [Thermoanaerobaculia bacterium]
MIWVETAAALAGILCVWLMMRQNIWCWPVGLVQVLLYIYVFYEVRLYSDLILHVIYVILQAYGWHYWLRGGARGGPVEATRMTPFAIASWIGVALAASAGWGAFMDRFTDADVPYGDAFAMMTSLVAQWLITRKKLESWLFWIAVDVVAIGVFAYKGLFVTAGLYLVFLGMAIAGYVQWRRSLGASDALPYEGWIDAREVRAAAPGPPVPD